MLEQGHDWLPSREERAEWTHVWRTLLENSEQLPESLPFAQVLEQGHDWLPSREERAEWAHVWQALLENAEQLPESLPFAQVLEQGYDWLADREERDEWVYVWQTLLKNSEQLPRSLEFAQVLGQGYDWLSKHEYSSEWGFMCERLLEHTYKNVAFLNLAEKWLQYTKKERPWSIIAAKFMVTVPEHPYSSEIARELIKRIHTFPNSNHWVKIEYLVDILLKLEEFIPKAINAFCEVYTKRSTEPAWNLARERMMGKLPVKGTVVWVGPKFSAVELDIGLLGHWPQDSSAPLKNRIIRDFFIHKEFKRIIFKLFHTQGYAAIFFVETDNHNIDLLTHS